MKPDLYGLPLTFYGHFTGYSSYPVVCQNLARWLIAQGVELQICDLRAKTRTDPDDPAGQRVLSSTPPWLQPYHVAWSYHAAILNRVAGSSLGRGELLPDRPDALGLFFGFPDYWPFLPRHRVRIGYHVGDVKPLPPRWKPLLERHCDLVLTPSRWCQGLLHELSLHGQTGSPIPVRVVPHGVDPEIFCPDETAPRPDAGPVRLLHFCTSPTYARKGTVELLVAMRELLTEPRWLALGAQRPRVQLLACVPASEVAGLAQSFMLRTEQGSLRILQDEPGPPARMAQRLRSCDVLVQPSRAEGFGCLALESVACGVPVVLLGQTGDADYLDDLEDAAIQVEPHGWADCQAGVAPALEPEALVRALAQAVLGLAYHREQARVRSAAIREKWSWTAGLDRTLLPLLRELGARAGAA